MVLRFEFPDDKSSIKRLNFFTFILIQNLADEQFCSNSTNSTETNNASFVLIMLPDVLRLNYQTLQTLLMRLQTLTNQAHPDIIVLQTTFLEAQQLFQLQILSFNLEELPPAIASRLQSLQTELSKQLRLLAMDISFLQSARQSITAQKRQAQMRDRIDLLLQYCEAANPTESGELDANLR